MVSVLHEIEVSLKQFFLGPVSLSSITFNQVKDLQVQRQSIDLILQVAFFEYYYSKHLFVLDVRPNIRSIMLLEVLAYLLDLLHLTAC